MRLHPDGVTLWHASVRHWRPFIFRDPNLVDERGVSTIIRASGAPVPSRWTPSETQIGSVSHDREHRWSRPDRSDRPLLYVRNACSLLLPIRHAMLK